MIKQFSCLITDVIRQTLSTCDYYNCNGLWMDYLMYVANNCSVVFNNEKYTELWNALFNICAEIGEQTSPFYLDIS